MLQMCMKYEYSEYYKYDWNINIVDITMLLKYEYWGDVPNVTEIWILRML